MSDRAERRQRYNQSRKRAMADPSHQGQDGPRQPGAIDPQLQLLIQAFSQAFSQIPAFQQPPVPPVAAPAPAVTTTQIIQQLPNNVIKLPTFYGTVVDASDPKSRTRCSPASVISCISRMDAFFDTYAQSYPTEDNKLNAIISCFPPNSAAQSWYESDQGKRSFATYAQFKLAFAQRFGPNAADEAKFQQDFFHVKQQRNESVGSFYTRYLQLLAEMKAINRPVDVDSQVAKFIDGLLPHLRTEVSRIHRRTPRMTLDAVMSEAEMEEKNTFPSKPAHMHVPPAVQGFQFRPNGDKSKKKFHRRKCFYCKDEKHLAKDCPEIAKKKANGTWVDRSRKEAGPSS
jgi:hypothetical protein